MKVAAADLKNQAGVQVSLPLAVRLRAAEQAPNPLHEAARSLLLALASTPAMLDPEAVAQRRQWLEHELRMFTRVCHELKLRADHVVRASYGLCTALDEAAMQAQWGKGNMAGADWQSNSLAVALDHDRQGGDRLFRLIDEALHSPREHLDLIELYQNILDLGFQGRYRYADTHLVSLMSIRKHVHDVVVTGGLGALRDSEPVPLRLPRQSVDPWVRPAQVRRSRVWLLAGLVTALLLGGAGYAVLAPWVRSQPAVLATSSLDALAQRLEVSLRDEITAGNVDLRQDQANYPNTLTLRFNGMYASGEVTVAPWWASVVASTGRAIATLAPAARVSVTGYTDNLSASTTPQGTNQALSEARAQQVAKILSASGVPLQHIDMSGQSDAEPLADNGTAQGRSRNRRVEVTISN
ncbi:type IVB secretion system protein IcmH/DotU [Paraburkholderia hayleyella]|uniref:type IVB secretion system protein IcmH/DotU n=1 Tax=Paraburkholderia hayleyella TaxID=2152889 RepID=UPI001292425E|nr:type IVB secretion system protein IcmH/DotU [Paraburkholderia hayleyella]